MRRTLAWAVVFWGAGALGVPAVDDVTTIAALQADPTRFNLRVVTVTGTVHLVQVLHATDPDASPLKLPPGAVQFDTQCAYLHPAYTFVLADDTGFLPVVVRARPPCVSKQMPPEPPDVADEDAVVLDVQITAVELEVNGVRRQIPEALALAIRKKNP